MSLTEPTSDDQHKETPQQKERAEKLMRAHNLMQFQLIQESGMDEMEWVETYAADFREAVTEYPGDDADTIIAKRKVMFACLQDDIERAVALFRDLRPDFPKRKVA